MAVDTATIQYSLIITYVKARHTVLLRAGVERAMFLGNWVLKNVYKVFKALADRT